MIKRYSVFGPDWTVEPDEEGEYVLYSDHIAALQHDRDRSGDVVWVKALDLRDIDSHPIAARFHNLAVELEKLPAGERQTEMVNVLDALRRDAQNLLNGHTFMQTSNVRMVLNIVDDICDGVEEPDFIGGTDADRPDTGKESE